MKKWKRFLCVALSAMFVIFALNPAADSHAGTSLSSITSDSIKEKQQQIKDAEALTKELKSNLTNAKEIKAQLESLKSDTAAYITKLDAELLAIQEKIDDTKAQIAEKEQEIAEITVELEEAIETEESQYEAMKKRIKFMYEKGDTFYLELMLNAQSFGDFLTKADYIEQLSAYDRKKLDEYTEIREWTELVKQTLEAEETALEELKASQEAEEASLEELLEEKETELANYQRDIATKEQQISNYTTNIEDQADLIEELEAAILAEQKAIAAKNGIVLTYDGGKFTWPAPSYVKITDDYGWRTHPITGKQSFHSGVDMAAPGGSPILAAYDGVVIAAGYNWSMGNYVMINHGSGLVTIYMHASKILCAVDDIVARGDKIALVGTTGSSTGNHLHFGVRLNGEYVSPWSYLK